MTPDELASIEKTLEVTLPASYKEVVLAYPIPAYAGNADTEVWDNAKRIVEFNLELRSGAPGGVKPWPTHMFATGHAGDGSPTALDLADSAAVWWVDRCHLDGAGSYRVTDSFSNWATEYFAGLKADLVGDGIDPDGTPDERNVLQYKNSGSKEFLGCVTVLLIVVALLALMRILGR